MSDTRDFTAKVGEDGMLPLHTRRALGAVLKGYSDRVVKITIKLQKTIRTPRQNAYYWSVVVPHWKLIFREYGTIATDDEVHAYLVTSIGKLFRPVRCPDGEVLYHEDGSPVREPMSTGDMSTKEFSEFTELCRATAATDHGHDIPPPDPDYKKGNDNDERSRSHEGQAPEAGSDEHGRAEGTVPGRGEEGGHG